MIFVGGLRHHLYVRPLTALADFHSHDLVVSALGSNKPAKNTPGKLFNHQIWL